MDAPVTSCRMPQIDFIRSGTLWDLARHGGSGYHPNSLAGSRSVPILDRSDEDIHKHFDNLNQALIIGLDPVYTLRLLRELVNDPRGLDHAIRAKLHETLSRVIATRRPHIVQEVLAVLTAMVETSLQGRNRAAFVEVVRLNICAKLLEITRERLQDHVTRFVPTDASNCDPKIEKEILPFAWKFALSGSDNGKFRLSRTMQLLGKVDWNTVFGSWFDVMDNWTHMLTVFMRATVEGWDSLDDDPDLYESLQVCIACCSNDHLEALLSGVISMLERCDSSSVAARIANAHLVDSVLQRCPVHEIVQHLRTIPMSCSLIEEHVLCFIAHLLDNLSDFNPDDSRYQVNVVASLIANRIGAVCIAKHSPEAHDTLKHDVECILRQMVKLTPSWCTKVGRTEG